MHKQTKIYARRKKSILGPTLAILLVSILVALGGTFYWEKLQDELAADGDVQANVNELIPKESAAEKRVQTQDNMSPGASEPETEDAAAAGTSTEQDEAPKENREAVSSALVPKSARVGDVYFDDAAFVGDSITEGIGLYQTMDNAKVIAAMGINLDTVFKDDQIRTKEGNKSVLSVLKETDPKKIYIMFGANGVGWFTPEHFKETYAVFLDEVKKQHPDSVIYLQSILPVTKGYEADESRNITNEKIDAYNQLVMEVAEEGGVYYLDVASAFKDETGALPDDSNGDGMHFSAAYYTKWFDYLKTHTAPEE